MMLFFNEEPNFWDPDTILFLNEESVSDLLGSAEFGVFICRLESKTFRFLIDTRRN